jgi:hypothetical protein
MENFRVVKISILAAAAAAVLLLLCAQGALAWNNVGVHPTINEYALNSFTGQWMPYDPYLKYASLNGEPVWGEAWDLVDGTSWHSRITPAIREKSLGQWLVDSGFSADEPELDMSLMHFYDPIRTPHYLTDNINDIPGGSYVNPEISAYQWAFTESGNPYGFENGKTYYKSALADTDPSTVNYGKAWRAVGETMHLISDMTIPAHVRNDGHIPYARLWDPLEYFTDASDVLLFGSGYPASTDLGNYHCAYTSDTDIRSLFQGEAAWTNENFFSADTVPRYGKTTTANGEPLYPSPTVTWSPSFEGYITTTVSGRTMNLTRQSLAGLIWKTPYLVVDQNVCNDQRSLLIPTSIKSSAAVLDAFLPRFRVVIDSVVPDEDYEGYYVITAHIQHIATREWPEDLPIRNGAHIVVDSFDYPVTTSTNGAGSDSLNRIRLSLEAETDSAIQVYYDLGGYQIASGEYRIPEVSSTSTPTPTPEAEPTAEPTAGADHELLTQINYWQSYPGNPVHEIYTYYIGLAGDGSSVELRHGYYRSYYSDGTSVYEEIYYGDGRGKWEKLYNPDGTILAYWTWTPEGKRNYIIGSYD